MIQRLSQPDEKENPDPRGDLDRILEVHLWGKPGARARRADDAPLGAPSWWHGDEEATQGFLRGMGVGSLEELHR